jgi:hypothetical protein
MLPACGEQSLVSEKHSVNQRLPVIRVLTNFHPVDRPRPQHCAPADFVTRVRVETACRGLGRAFHRTLGRAPSLIADNRGTLAYAAQSLHQ